MQTHTVTPPDEDLQSSQTLTAWGTQNYCSGEQCGKHWEVRCGWMVLAAKWQSRLWLRYFLEVSIWEATQIESYIGFLRVCHNEHRLSGLNNKIFSQFWRLEAWDQGVSRVGLLKPFSLAWRWPPSPSLFTGGSPLELCPHLLSYGEHQSYWITRGHWCDLILPRGSEG